MTTTLGELDEILPNRLTYTHKQWVEARYALLAWRDAAIREAVVKELEFVLWHESEPAKFVEFSDDVITVTRIENRIAELKRKGDR